ncbi:MAG: hypothetical protein KUG82_09170 [Pseudomonadales bacterium]|nr:hypothetical protein [Pseudomonadales bacterium]
MSTNYAGSQLYHRQRVFPTILSTALLTAPVGIPQQLEPVLACPPYPAKLLVKSPHFLLKWPTILLNQTRFSSLG